MSASIEVSFSLSCSSASILLLHFVFMMASEEKPSSHRYVVAERRRRHTELSESAGYSQCCCFQKSNNAFWKKTLMFRRTIILLKSPAHQQWSPWAFQRFWCSTGFSSSCSLLPSLRNIGVTVMSESCHTMMLFRTIESSATRFLRKNE